MRFLGAAFLVSSLTGCGGGHPEPAELYGLWARPPADGNIGVFEFADSDAVDPVLAGLTDVYHLYVYAEGTSPIEVQSGSFQIAKGDGWELVTTVKFDPEGAYTDVSFGNPIAKFTGDVLTLDRDDGTQVEYAAVDAMP